MLNPVKPWRACLRPAPAPQWVGYIKDYDGGTLMECLLDEKVPWARIPPMIRAQRAALDSRIRGLSQSHVVYAGLPASHFERSNPEDLQLASIPGGRSPQAHASCRWTRSICLCSDRFWPAATHQRRGIQPFVPAAVALVAGLYHCDSLVAIRGLSADAAPRNELSPREVLVKSSQVLSRCLVPAPTPLRGVRAEGSA